MNNKRPSEPETGDDSYIVLFREEPEDEVEEKDKESDTE